MELRKIHANRAKEQCDNIDGLKVTLRRLPNVETIAHVDDARYAFFTKQLWDKLYEDNPGYTVLFVSSYLDFVRLRTFFKNKNAQVAFISEYSEKKDCQRNRQFYETKEKPILLVTERAIIFDKIQLRYARNVILYSLPESQDTFTDVLCPLTNESNFDAIMKVRLNLLKNTLSKKHRDGAQIEELMAKETHSLMRERKVCAMSKALVGLFSKYDNLQLERVVGTAAYRKMIKNEAKDSWTIIGGEEK